MVVPPWLVRGVCCTGLLVLTLGLAAPGAALASEEGSARGGCTSDLDCSLNGVCTAGVCVCDKPWTGESCGVMAYKVTPVSGADLFPLNKSHNTWNGPIMGPYDGKYHLFLPYYGNYTGIKSLFRVEYIMHGVADRIEGPYAWGVEPNLPGGINPAALAFFNATTGKTVYTLWNGNIRAADTPFGPWRNLGSDCGGNSAPVYHDGVFYCTSQHTLEVFTATDLEGRRWEKYSDINVTLANGTNAPYARLLPNVEDPFMWIDKRGNWHIINHRFWNETTHCYSSTLSAHTFSPDGKSWHIIEPAVEPYSHTVKFDDGSTVSFVALERPNIHFDATGQMTHINLAADLTTNDTGCGSGKSCDYCKFLHHCGTVIIALDV